MQTAQVNISLNGDVASCGKKLHRVHKKVKQVTFNYTSF